MGFSAMIEEAAKHLGENLDGNMDTKVALREFARELETAAGTTKKALNAFLETSELQASK